MRAGSTRSTSSPSSSFFPSFASLSRLADACSALHSKIMAQNPPMSAYFDDFDGPDGDLEAATAYMKHKFVSLNRRKDRGLYVHLTCVRSRSFCLEENRN